MVTDTKTRTIEPDIVVFEISGRLGLGNTLYSIESAIRKVIDDGSRKLIIDLAGLSYIDSAGIGMLIGCNGHMNQSGGQFRIAGAQGVVQQSFRIVRIEAIVPLDPDIATACGNLDRAASA